MKTIAASRFKAEALALLDVVAASGEEIVVTKRGKPVARVVPCAQGNDDVRPGWLAGTVLFMGDIVAPIDEVWEAEP